MKTKAITLLLLSSLLLGSCTSSQFAGVTAGSTLGAMFGSSIGGLIGGPRGSDIGTLTGMVLGGATGAAVTSGQNGDAPDRTDYDSDRPRYQEYQDSYDRERYCPVQYGRSYEPTRTYAAPKLEVTAIRFNDSDGDRCLRSGERAYIELDIYNRSGHELRDVAPIISCDNRRIALSPPAKISVLPAGRGFRYKAEVVAPQRLRNGQATFRVAFGTDRQAVTASTFRINTAR